MCTLRPSLGRPVNVRGRKCLNVWSRKRLFVALYQEMTEHNVTRGRARASVGARSVGKRWECVCVWVGGGGRGSVAGDESTR